MQQHDRLFEEPLIKVYQSIFGVRKATQIDAQHYLAMKSSVCLIFFFSLVYCSKRHTFGRSNCSMDLLFQGVAMRCAHCAH